MKNNPFSRFSLLGVLFSLLGALLLLQLFRIQTSAATYKVMQDNDKKNTVIDLPIETKRGDITDRWGNLLAGSKTVYEIGIDLINMVKKESVASALATITGADYNETLARINYGLDHSLTYIRLTDFIDPTKEEEIMNVKKSFQADGSNVLSGLMATPHLQRTYPENTLASNILGFYSYLDTETGHGYFGIEEKYNEYLAGTKQIYRYARDPYQIQSLPQDTSGADLILTIDREIQAAMERLADKALKETKSQTATIIVADPKTGEILAMATTPQFNPNEYWTYDKTFPDSLAFNRAIGATYEPGSVFKVLTMAAALDSGAVKPETTFTDTGSIVIGGIRIYNWDRAAYGLQTMTGCLEHSLNVCLTWVAEQLGTTRFYDYMKAFGIGHRTNIDLEGEANWPLTLPGDPNWYTVNLGTNSFGQGLAVTPIQMIEAITAVANGQGKMMAPHLLKAMVDKGRQYDNPPQVVGNPISAQTAKTETEMLATSLEKEASIALVPGYRVAGKTGTGEIPGPNGYVSGVTNASFVGWGPVDDPRFLIYIWLEKPATSIWGSVVAAPVFSEAFMTVATLSNLPPDAARLQLYGQ
ncbi:MAG TPA: penicillin-binding protein 2 [Anaerolineaceae bacterium]